MPPKIKTEAEKQQLRTLIIDAARELFVSKGVEAVTMREIAKRIGYSATSIYLHFADKETLLRAICDADLLTLAKSQQAALEIKDPVARMQAIGAGYAQFALSYPNHYRLMFMTPHAPCGPQNSELQQNNPEQDAYYQLKSAVKEAIEQGCFKPEHHDAELVAQTAWASMHGVCALEIIMARDTWVDWRSVMARLQHMQTLLIQGLLKA